MKKIKPFNENQIYKANTINFKFTKKDATP